VFGLAYLMYELEWLSPPDIHESPPPEPVHLLLSIGGNCLAETGRASPPDADHDPLPVGTRDLMMGSNADGHLRPELLQGRDGRLGMRVNPIIVLLFGAAVK
jgi:hypothetical protein